MSARAALRIALVAAILGFAGGGVLADGILEVTRSANIYAEPSRSSAVVHQVSPEEGGFSVLNLVEDEKQNGYYRVAVPGETDSGWIYKTYVRRLTSAQAHPKYVAYSRSLYKHWIDENKNCRDTRTEVLIRDSKSKPTYSDEARCDVTGGRWIDPYTAKVVQDPRELDIDHLVPLKNAHEAGAWAWSAERRKAYANFMADRNHLLAVSASENRRKADKGPERYMPPNSDYACEYLRSWSKVKRDWGLSMTQAERATVMNRLEECVSQ